MHLPDAEIALRVGVKMQNVSNGLHSFVAALPPRLQYQNREPWIEPLVRSRLHEYQGGIIRRAGGFPHAIGGVGDHVHLLVALRATHCLADVMRELKSESSRWVHDELLCRIFAWQEGYGAFTVSASQVENAKAYVFGQEKHHRQKTFQEEYVGMLKRGLVEYDERYLW